MKVNTSAVHSGQRDSKRFEFPVPEIVPNSAVLLRSVEDGWNMFRNKEAENIAYQRYANPTVMVLEKKFKSLEECKYSLAVNSGMTACYLLFRTLLSSGDHIVTQHSLYHEISDQIKFDKKSCGIEYTFIKNYSTKNFEKAIKPTTKMIFIETPTNPAMYDVDIPALATVCKKHKIVFVADNTFLTPIYQKPLKLGADITVYSTTKSINGHGDALGGIISTNNQEIYYKLREFRDYTGLTIDPFSAWLTIRGMRTLPLRLDKHSQNAKSVVEFLKLKYSEYETKYPILCKSSIKNKVVDGGGIISIVLRSKEQGLAFIENLKIFRIGTTFGNLESLCYHFGGFARPSRDIKQIGIPYGLVRLSIGIEDVSDIISDIDQALRKVNKIK